MGSIPSGSIPDQPPGIKPPVRQGTTGSLNGRNMSVKTGDAHTPGSPNVPIAKTAHVSEETLKTPEPVGKANLGGRVSGSLEKSSLQNTATHVSAATKTTPLAVIQNDRVTSHQLNSSIRVLEGLPRMGP